MNTTNIAPFCWCAGDLSAAEQLEKLAGICHTPKAPTLDLKSLWAQARDMPAVHVRRTLEELVMENFRHKADPARWHELPSKPHVYPECLQPKKAKLIDEKFLKEVKAGRYICNSNINIIARVPVFLKQEGPDKYRLIPNYSYT